MYYESHDSQGVSIQWRIHSFTSRHVFPSDNDAHRLDAARLKKGDSSASSYLLNGSVVLKRCNEYVQMINRTGVSYLSSLAPGLIRSLRALLRSFSSCSEALFFDVPGTCQMEYTRLPDV